MMALMNNWDLKDVNNAVYEESNNGGASRSYATRSATWEQVSEPPA